MIITVSPVNIHHPCIVTRFFFFLMMRIFEIYCLRNFQRGNTVLLTLVTMLPMTSTQLSYLTTGSCQNLVLALAFYL